MKRAKKGPVPNICSGEIRTTDDREIMVKIEISCWLFLSKRPLVVWLEPISTFAVIFTWNMPLLCCWISTTQKMKSSIKDFFSKCDQIRRFLRIWSHLLEKSLIESFIFYVVKCQHNASIHNVFKLKSKIFAMIVKIVIMLKTNDL